MIRSDEAPGRRVALITGATRGIGRATALRLADSGYDIAFTHVASPELARQVSLDVESRGVIARSARYDLAVPRSASAVVHELLQDRTRLDALILNAGIWKGGRLGSMSSDDWWSVLEANLRGNEAVVRAALPWLTKRSGSSIVFISSVVGLIGFAGDTAYSSSKAAMVGFARSLAKETARAGLRVNVVAPGFVETDMTSGVSSGSRADIAEQTLMRRFGTADEVAKAVVYLAHDATYTTGAVLTVDGGWTL